MGAWAMALHISNLRTWWRQVISAMPQLVKPAVPAEDVGAGIAQFFLEQAFGTPRAS
jgi:hypothetical protein